MVKWHRNQDREIVKKAIKEYRKTSNTAQEIADKYNITRSKLMYHYDKYLKNHCIEKQNKKTGPKLLGGNLNNFTPTDEGSKIDNFLRTLGPRSKANLDVIKVSSNDINEQTSPVDNNSPNVINKKKSKKKVSSIGEFFDFNKMDIK